MRLITFEKTNRWNFSNALHARFQRKMCEIVTSNSVPTSTLNIRDEILSEWRQYVDLEIDHNRDVRASALTKVLKEQDRLRIQFITHLFDEIRTQVKSPLSSKAEAAAFLIPIVNAYKGIQGEAMGDRTIHLHGLLMDLDKAENQSHVAAAGLEDTVEALRQANADFEATYENRESSKVDNVTAATRKLRANTDKYFKAVCILIEAAYITSTSAADQTAIEQLVHTINHHINAFRTAHNQSVAQKNGAGSGSGTSSQDTDITLPTSGDSDSDLNDGGPDEDPTGGSSEDNTGDNSGGTTGDNSGGTTGGNEEDTTGGNSGDTTGGNSGGSQDDWGGFGG